MRQKNILPVLAVLIILFLTACNSNNKDSSKEKNNKPHGTEEVVYNLNNFFDIADSLSGNTVKVEGIVDHVCKHSAKRFKIIDAEGKHELKIETTKKLPSFDPANIGKKVLVTGKVIATRLYLNDIKKWEQQIIKNHEEEKETEHFKEEIKLVHEITDKIVAGEIEHHSIYHIEAINYEILSE